MSDTNIEGEGCRECDKLERSLELAEARIASFRAELQQLRAERDALVLSTGVHLTVRSEQTARIAALEAAIDAWRTRTEAHRAAAEAAERGAVLAESALEARDRRIAKLEAFIANPNAPPADDPRDRLIADLLAAACHSKTCAEVVAYPARCDCGYEKHRARAAAMQKERQ